VTMAMRSTPDLIMIVSLFGFTNLGCRPQFGDAN